MEGHIEKTHWAKFLTDFSETYQGYETRIEIIGRAFGDQEEVAWLPLMGVSYDWHHEQIIITVGGLSSRYPAHLTHSIDHPKTLHVRHAPAGDTSSLLIVAPDKTETLVTLRQPLRLPE